jgi:hypothetical protein
MDLCGSEENADIDETSGKIIFDLFRRLVEGGIDVRAQNGNGLTAAQLLDNVPKNIKILPKMIQMLSAAASIPFN